MTYNLQDTPNRFGFISNCFIVAAFQNDLSMCSIPEKRMSLTGFEKLSDYSYRSFGPKPRLSLPLKLLNASLLS